MVEGRGGGVDSDDDPALELKSVITFDNGDEDVASWEVEEEETVGEEGMNPDSVLGEERRLERRETLGGGVRAPLGCSLRIIIESFLELANRSGVLVEVPLKKSQQPLKLHI